MKKKFFPDMAPRFRIQTNEEREKERETRSRSTVGTMALIDATIFVSTKATKSRSIYLGWSGSYVHTYLLCPPVVRTRETNIRFSGSSKVFAFRERECPREISVRHANVKHTSFEVRSKFYQINHTISLFKNIKHINVFVRYPWFIYCIIHKEI